MREGIVGWELFDADDESFDEYLTEVELPEIYPIADKMSMHYEKIREHFPVSNWKGIIEKDDVKAFEEKYKKHSLHITTEFMQDIFINDADKCFEWILDNIEFSSNWFLYFMSKIMLHDDNTSKKMMDRFTKFHEGLSRKPVDRIMSSDIIENAVLTAHDTDFYFDAILDDDRFHYTSEDGGSIGLFKRYINNYKVMNTEEEREKLLAKVQKKKEELERTE